MQFQRVMIKRVFQSIKEFFSIQMSQETLDDLNRQGCRLLLITGVLLCLLVYVTDRVIDQGWSPVSILGLSAFSVLAGIYITNRQYAYTHATVMLECFAACILFFLAYTEPPARKDAPVFALLIAMLVIPPLIADSPWKLLLLLLATGMLALFFNGFVEAQEIRDMNIRRILSVTFLSCVQSCFISHARLDMLRKHADSKTTAEHDPLTGLLNRGGGTAMIQDCLRRQMSGTFVIIDIDDFKHINDTYGHQKGDEVLQAVAAILQHSFKNTDIVMRMGGDEFIVYAVGMADENVVRYRLEKLVDSVGEVPAGGEGTEHVSISIGAAVNDGTYPNYEALYRTADKYLYETKSKGKNGFNLHSVSFRYSAD